VVAVQAVINIAVNMARAVALVDTFTILLHYYLLAHLL
jgi:hypothetical protein